MRSPWATILAMLTIVATLAGCSRPTVVERAGDAASDTAGAESDAPQIERLRGGEPLASRAEPEGDTIDINALLLETIKKQQQGGDAWDEGDPADFPIGVETPEADSPDDWIPPPDAAEPTFDEQESTATEPSESPRKRGWPWNQPDGETADNDPRPKPPERPAARREPPPPRGEFTRPTPRARYQIAPWSRQVLPRDTRVVGPQRYGSTVGPGRGQLAPSSASSASRSLYPDALGRRTVGGRQLYGPGGNGSQPRGPTATSPNGAPRPGMRFTPAPQQPPRSTGLHSGLP